jgi:hypothetical protein
MTAGQDDAAMIHLCGYCVRWSGLKFSAFNKRASAGGTPVLHGLFGEHGPAMAAYPFHISKITGSGLPGFQNCL